MKTALAISCALIVTVPAVAQPTLLAEISHSGFSNDPSSPAFSPNQVNVGTVAFVPGGQTGFISDCCTSADVGRVITATPSELTGFRDALRGQSAPNASLFMIAVDDRVMATVNNFFWGTRERWDDAAMTWVPDTTNLTQVTTHVPRRGVGLTGYQISSMTATLTRRITTISSMPPSSRCAFLERSYPSPHRGCYLHLALLFALGFVVDVNRTRLIPWRFSNRTLLIATTLVAVVLGIVVVAS